MLFLTRGVCLSYPVVRDAMGIVLYFTKILHFWEFIGKSFLTSSKEYSYGSKYMKFRILAFCPKELVCLHYFWRPVMSSDERCYGNRSRFFSEKQCCPILKNFILASPFWPPLGILYLFFELANLWSSEFHSLDGIFHFRCYLDLIFPLHLSLLHFWEPFFWIWLSAHQLQLELWIIG